MANRVNDEIIPLGTSWEPPPPDFYDPVIEAYKKDVDRTMLRENLKLTIAERFEQFDKFAEFVEELQAAGKRMRETTAREPGHEPDAA
ncbi:MAG TPA: hypothetical protein VGI40_13755 [Pirellulaceae bacterium]|jgi:hypothetical protein